VTPPFRRVRIKNFLEMWRDGVLAFFNGEEVDPDMPALSRYVYADTGADVEDELAVFPGDNSPVSQAHLKTLADILGKYASANGWDGIEIGGELGAGDEDQEGGGTKSINLLSDTPTDWRQF